MCFTLNSLGIVRGKIQSHVYLNCIVLEMCVCQRKRINQVKIRNKFRIAFAKVNETGINVTLNVSWKRSYWASVLYTKNEITQISNNGRAFRNRTAVSLWAHRPTPWKSFFLFLISIFSCFFVCVCVWRISTEIRWRFVMRLPLSFSSVTLWNWMNGME